MGVHQGVCLLRHLFFLGKGADDDKAFQPLLQEHPERAVCFLNLLVQSFQCLAERKILIFNYVTIFLIQTRIFAISVDKADLLSAWNKNMQQSIPEKIYDRNNMNLHLDIANIFCP